MRQILARLRSTRTDLVAQIASTRWEKFALPRMQAAVETAMRRFGAEYEDILGRHAAEAWVLGEQVLPEMVSAASGVTAPFPALDPGVLTVAQSLHHDLITDVTEEANARILGEIKRGMMGDLPQVEVIRRVGRNLTDGSVFKTIADRAEVITRTETNRVYNMANAERDKQFADSAPALGLKVFKRWIATKDPRTRIAHLRANGQEVPIDEPFVVGGEELAFPLDPAGSPGNTINCRCTYRRVFRKEG